jgi:hypothetical protein
MRFLGVDFKFQGFDIWHKGNLSKLSELTNDSGFITSNASTSGNSATSTKWAVARNISLTGDVTGNVDIDGSGSVSIDTTVEDKTNYNKILAMTIALGG